MEVSRNFCPYNNFKSSLFYSILHLIVDFLSDVIISVGQKDEQEKKQTSVLVKPNKPPGGNSGRGRPTKPTLEQKLNNDHEMKLKEKSDKRKFQSRPVSTQQNVSIRRVSISSSCKASISN